MHNMWRKISCKRVRRIASSKLVLIDRNPNLVFWAKFRRNLIIREILEGLRLQSRPNSFIALLASLYVRLLSDGPIEPFLSQEWILGPFDMPTGELEVMIWIFLLVSGSQQYIRLVYS